MALLSIVLPSYNEEQNIAHTTQVLSELLQQEQIDYELIFVSDGSKDGTYQEILKAAEQNPRVRGAQFSRNFGKEASIFAGLQLAAGDAVVVMDCDLQHPPQVIVQMWKLWNAGYEVVEGIKTSATIGGNQDQPGPGEFPAQVLCRGFLQDYERSDQDGYERLLGL